MFISWRYTLHLYLFATECDTLWLVRLDAWRVDGNLLPQHETLLHQHCFHNG